MKSFEHFFFNLIKASLTGNDSLNYPFHCKIETYTMNLILFPRNTTKHHVQNQDLFDEENDSK